MKEPQAIQAPFALLRAATDPTTPPARLRRIVEIAERSGTLTTDSPRRSLLEAVAANPNVPPDILARLATLLPDAVLTNPVLPLMALEAPNFASGIGTRQAHELLRRAGIPHSLLALLMSDMSRPELAEEARMHREIAGEVGPNEDWRTAVRTWFTERLQQATTREKQSVDELVALKAAPQWAAEGLESNIWEEPMTPESVAEAYFAKLPDPVAQSAREQFAIARDPLTTPEYRAELLRRKSLFATLGLAFNPTLAAAEVHALLKIVGYTQVADLACAILALHPNTPPDALVFLAGVYSPAVRRSACHHPAAIPEVRTAARRAAVHHALAQSHAPHRVLLARFAALLGGRGEPAWEPAVHRAAEGGAWYERLAVVLALPDIDALSALAEDGNRYVRAAARERLSDPSRLPEPL